MSQEQALVAHLHAANTAQKVAPLVEERKDKIAQQFASDAIRHAVEAGEREQGEANARFVLGAVSLLPKVTADVQRSLLGEYYIGQRAFETESAATVLLLNRSVVWGLTYNPDLGDDPHYIIGQHNRENLLIRPSLLLKRSSAIEADDGAKIVESSDYESADGELYVSTGVEHARRTVTYTGMRPVEKILDETVSKREKRLVEEAHDGQKYRVQSGRRYAGSGGETMGKVVRESDSHAISGADMDKFKVFEALNDLALVFGKSAEFSDLYATWRGELPAQKIRSEASPEAIRLMAARIGIVGSFEPQRESRDVTANNGGGLLDLTEVPYKSRHAAD